jgi:glycosyltransferase involved in cell wall biosynthesis
MKILIAADLHWPTINGVATFSRNLAKGLSARGHEVWVIAPSQTGKSYEEYDGNYLIKRTASVPFPFYQNFRISLAPQLEVKKIVQEFKPDVIHLQMCLAIGNATLRAGNKYGIPIVATNHAMPENLLDNMRILAPVSRPINYLITEYGAWFHGKVDYVTLPTRSAIELFTDKPRLAKVEAEAVSNGIDLSRFTPSKASDDIYKKFNIPKNKKIVSYVGRLDAEKHLAVLVKAFKRVTDMAKTPAHLLIVGDGTDREHLMNLAHEYGIAKHVTFTGRVTDDEIRELHKVGDVFCMPSPAELQSISTLEAMASGKPVVAVDAGALGELCQEGKNGYLCRQDDDEQIAASLATILDDAELRKKFGETSLEIAKTHDIEHTLDRFEEIYQLVTSDVAIHS